MLNVKKHDILRIQKNNDIILNMKKALGAKNELNQRKIVLSKVHVKYAKTMAKSNNASGKVSIKLSLKVLFKFVYKSL